MTDDVDEAQAFENVDQLVGDENAPTEPDGGDDLEELRQATEAGSRLDAADEADQAAAEADDLPGAIVEQLERIDEGDLGTTIAFRDRYLAALFAAAEARGELIELVPPGRRSKVDDAPKKTEVLSQLVREGLDEEQLEAISEAGGRMIS